MRHCFHLTDDPADVENYIQLRANALYSEDERQEVRQSHNNPQIIELYEKFLGEPNSELAHHLLHTTYAERKPFRIHAQAAEE